MVGFISNLAALAACDAIVDRVDLNTPPGHLLVYSGSVPTDADTALGAQVLLADLTMSNPAFGAAADIAPGARATASAITDDSSANATGTASFFRIAQGAGTAVMQGACATSGQELNFNSTAISSGAIVSVTSFTVTVPES
jgi:hypothetical protein